MKKLLLVLATFAALSSCKKDSLPYGNQYDDSFQSWNTFKVETNNSYNYIAYSASIFGASSETKISVKNGVVIGRTFTAYKSNDTGAPVVVKTWTEDQTTLNTHTDGSAPITLDEVYKKAKADWLSADKSDNDIVFETGSYGLITSCGYIPKGCADDCFIGINIKSVMPL